MKKSINAWTFPDDYGFEDCISAAKGAGLEAIEFNLDKVGRSSHSFTLESTEEEILRVRSLLSEYGIIPASISSSLHGGLWARREEDAVKNAFAILEKQLKENK